MPVKHVEFRVGHGILGGWREGERREEEGGRVRGREGERREGG